MDTLPSSSLPSWLTELLPPFRDPVKLSHSEPDGFTLTLLDGEVRHFTDLPSAHGAYLSLEGDPDLFVEQSVYDFVGGKYFLSYPVGDKGYSSIVMSRTDEDRHRTLVSGYEHFLKNAASYDSNPGDFLASWEFIDTHPAFWTALDLEKNPWFWEQNGYANKLSVSPYLSESGDLVFRVEGGGHVPEETNWVDGVTTTIRYRNHYADWRLDVAAGSYEDAIVAFAERVRLVFNLDGSQRDDSETGLVAPEWVIEVQRRLDELDWKFPLISFSTRGKAESDFFAELCDAYNPGVLGFMLSSGERDAKLAGLRMRGVETELAATL